MTPEKESHYEALVLQKYGGKLNIKKIPHRNLNKGELLIKVAGATIHPSDLMFLIGEYGGAFKPTVFPMTPGFEGCGEIVDVGPEGNRSLIGKRVAITVPFSKDGTFNGVWAQYHYTTLTNVIVFDKDIAYEKICFATVNPLTAVGFLDTVRKHNQKVVVQNGASGALGKMFIRLCAKEGITTINLVRNSDHILDLKKIGADHVISTDNPTWEKEFTELTKDLNARILFDCIGGNMSGKMFGLMPANSTMYNFGNLEIKKLGIDSVSLIFGNKKVYGWWLVTWLRGLTPKERQMWFEYVAKDLQSGSDIFLSKVSREFNLKEIADALNYYNKNMSQGKVILRAKF